MSERISIPTPSALLEALRLVGPNHGHVEVWERGHRELDALVQAVEAARKHCEGCPQCRDLEGWLSCFDFGAFHSRPKRGSDA